jgi:hypothetical protein
MAHLPTVIRVGIACSMWFYEFLPDPTKGEDAEHYWLVPAMILNRAAYDALAHIHVRHRSSCRRTCRING